MLITKHSETELKNVNMRKMDVTLPFTGIGHAHAGMLVQKICLQKVEETASKNLIKIQTCAVITSSSPLLVRLVTTSIN